MPYSAYSFTGSANDSDYWRRQYEDEAYKLEQVNRDIQRQRDDRMAELQERLREGETTASSWGDAFNKHAHRVQMEAAYENPADGIGTYFTDLLPAAKKTLQLWEENRERIEARLNAVLKEELGAIADQIESEFGNRGEILRSLRENNFEPLVNW